MTDSKPKPYSGDRWKYHKNECVVIGKDMTGISKKTMETYEIFLKKAKENKRRK